MEGEVHLSAAANKLNELKHDTTELLQQNVTNGTTKNEEKRSETSSSESSDCQSLAESDDSSREDDFHTKLQIVTTPLVINVKKATKFKDNPTKHMEVYPMRRNPRGIVLIIANNLYDKEDDQRPGAKHDEANLRLLFEGMGFKVISHFDLQGKEIDDKIDEFSVMDELRKADSAFVIISSHGNGKVGLQETEILGVDYDRPEYKKVVCTKIINYFTANNCRNLRGKPKVFIFQTCRGNNEQYAVSRHRSDTATPITKPCRVEGQSVHFSDTLRDHEDMLIVYSTIPGYVSYRDQFNGSWFIQILCEVFMNHAYKFHVQDLFSMIDHRLKNMRTPLGKCQTPSITVRGFNKCYLNPGLFENKDTNVSIENNPNKRPDVMFKCCPDRRANVGVCFQCDAVYHYKCAKKLDHVQFMSKVKVDCCCFSNNRSTSDESDNKSLSENVEELKKVLCDLKEENHHLKEQVATLQTQHDEIMSSEKNLKNAEETLRKQNLIKENNLLQQIVNEMRENNNHLREKNERLTKKMNKKCLRQRLGKVLKRKRKKPLNTVEPEEI